MQRTISNPVFWLTLAFNAWLIVYYTKHPEGFKTLLLLYWLQSLAIGFSTLVQLLALPTQPAPGATKNSALRYKGCQAGFFVMHYGIFHLVYLVFIVAGQKGAIDTRFLLLSAAILFLSEILWLAKKLPPLVKTKANLGFIFFLPYLRIVPMHLILVGASVAGISNVTLFLVLKTMADLAMLVVGERLYSKALQSVNQ